MVLHIGQQNDETSLLPMFIESHRMLIRLTYEKKYILLIVIMISISSGWIIDFFHITRELKDTSR